jgi:hypothetical protein
LRYGCGSTTSDFAHRLLAAPCRTTFRLGRRPAPDLAQGYFISRPASAEYLKPILEERALRTRDGIARAS